VLQGHSPGPYVRSGLLSLVLDASKRAGTLVKRGWLGGGLIAVIVVRDVRD